MIPPVFTDRRAGNKTFPASAKKRAFPQAPAAPDGISQSVDYWVTV
jgi:hypothetical protein